MVQEILCISKQIVEALKIVHTSKRVHNDIKPENIMMKTLPDGTTQAYLIDFGMASKYYDSEYNHISEEYTNKDFRGNLLFSSLRQMKFLKTSRKDDTISLFYMIIYLLNGKKLVTKDENLINNLDKTDDIELFQAIRKYKYENDLNSLVQNLSLNRSMFGAPTEEQLDLDEKSAEPLSSNAQEFFLTL